MLITAVEYASEEKTMLKVMTSDVGILSVAWPCDTYHNDAIQAWIRDGHTIADWIDPVDYMAKMRDERDRRISGIYWRIERRQTQDAGGIAPSDNNSKMDEVYIYLQALRDMPGNNPGTDTKDKYRDLVWPSVPA